jgi:hypothetical protein
VGLLNKDHVRVGSGTLAVGGLTDDTIELRDGSILTGEVVSMTLESIVVDVQGQQQKLERNKVKKIFLVERTITTTTGGTSPAAKDKKKTADSSSAPNRYH